MSENDQPREIGEFRCAVAKGGGYAGGASIEVSASEIVQQWHLVIHQRDRRIAPVHILMNPQDAAALASALEEYPLPDLPVGAIPR